MELYEFVAAIVADEKKYEMATAKDKNAYFFLCNRIMAIANPEMAMKFNMGCDAEFACDTWRLHFDSKGYRKTPRWIWTKFANKHAKVEDSLKKFSKDILVEYCIKNDIGLRELQLCALFDESAVLEELKFLDSLKKEKIKQDEHTNQ